MYSAGLVAVFRTPLALCDSAVLAVVTTVLDIRGVHDAEDVYELLHRQVFVLTVAEAALPYQD